MVVVETEESKLIKSSKSHFIPKVMCLFIMDDDDILLKNLYFLIMNCISLRTGADTIIIIFLRETLLLLFRRHQFIIKNPGLYKWQFPTAIFIHIVPNNFSWYWRRGQKKKENEYKWTCFPPPTTRILHLKRKSL